MKAGWDGRLLLAVTMMLGGDAAGLVYEELRGGQENITTRPALLWDGPVLLSTVPITGSSAVARLRRELVKGLAEGTLENTAATRILVLTGTHGDQHGNSVLTDSKLEYIIYYQCDWILAFPLLMLYRMSTLPGQKMIYKNPW